MNNEKIFDNKFYNDSKYENYERITLHIIDNLDKSILELVE